MACECGDEVRVVMNSERVPGDNGIPAGTNRSAKRTERGSGGGRPTGLAQGQPKFFRIQMAVPI